MFRGLSREVEDYLKVVEMINNDESDIKGLTDEQKEILFKDIDDESMREKWQLEALVKFFNYLTNKYEYDPRDFAHFEKSIIQTEIELRNEGSPRFYYLEYGSLYNNNFIYRANWFDIFRFKRTEKCYSVLESRRGAIELLGQFPLRNRMMCNRCIIAYAKLMEVVLRPDVDEYTIQLLTDDPEEYKRVVKEYGDKIDKEALEASKEFAELMFG